MKLTIQKIAFLIILLSFFSFCKAQSDTTIVVSNADTSVVDTSKNNWSKTEKAGLMSALVPGLGQYYNKKYWKIPIVWAGQSALLYNVFRQHKEYAKARDAINQYNIDSLEITARYIGRNWVDGLSNFRTARDERRRNRDYFIILSSLFYGLNIVDAVVDAHLSEFDISNDLSLNIKPNFYPINNTFAAGVTFNFKLK